MKSFTTHVDEYFVWRLYRKSIISGYPNFKRVTIPNPDKDAYGAAEILASELFTDCGQPSLIYLNRKLYIWVQGIGWANISDRSLHEIVTDALKWCDCDDGKPMFGRGCILLKNATLPRLRSALKRIVRVSAAPFPSVDQPNNPDELPGLWRRMLA